MMKQLFPALLLLIPACSSPPGVAPQPVPSGQPQIINVSAYDPKEKHRPGKAYSQHDVTALRANGASALIARAGKGGNLDEKCAAFLAATDHAGMLPGIYYRVQRHVDAVAQADQFVDRAFALARSRVWRAPSLLLCGDFDGDLPLTSILRFMDRVESRTGIIPVAYLENSTQLKQTLSSASPSAKARLRQMPYWLALYAHDSGAGPVYPAPVTPEGLVRQYQVWSNWALWQYGGVAWESGRSRPKVYHHGRYRFPLYFGDMDRPLERSIFHGSHASLHSFWQRHGLRLR